MKNVIIYLCSVFETFGRARAASYFARQGDYESARRIMAE